MNTTTIQDQPAPTHNALTPVWDLVIQDMQERNQVGIQRYGTPLQPFNGRDALVDAYQEALDLAVYLRQAIVERTALDDLEQEHRMMRARNERLEAELAAVIEQPAQRKPLWIDPNDKTQERFLPNIGEPVLFCHEGKTYYGKHNGGSFQYRGGIAKQYFNTWECRWMYLPAAHGIKGNA